MRMHRVHHTFGKERRSRTMQRRTVMLNTSDVRFLCTTTLTCAQWSGGQCTRRNRRTRGLSHSQCLNVYETQLTLSAPPRAPRRSSATVSGAGPSAYVVPGGEGTDPQGSVFGPHSPCVAALVLVDQLRCVHPHQRTAEAECNHP